MPSPFPGMDPYLETGQLWRTLHTHLVVEICKDLQPQIVPRYVARSEERVVLGPREQAYEADVSVREHRGGTGGVATASRPAETALAVPETIIVPDLTLRHRFVAIRDVQGREVVTVIEVLSPWNKTGQGLEEYRSKQGELLLSQANLVEVDLLRRGGHAVAVPEALAGRSDYCISIHPSGAGMLEVFRFGVRDPLPNVRIPLRPGDEEPVLHLGAVFRRAYDGGAYGLDVDYDADPDPPLAGEDAAWARALLRQRPGAGPAGNEGNTREDGD
jgi:hypothetical protein